MNAVVLAWLTLCMIWGSTWLFIKLGLQDLPPFTFAGIRFLLASIILSLVIYFRKTRLPQNRGDWLFIAWTGFLCVTVNFALVFWAGQYVSSGLAALLNATMPFFGMIIAPHYLPAERITPAKLGGVVLGMTGVGLIFSNQLSLQGMLSLFACIAIVVGALVAAYANVLIKLRGRHLDPVVLSAGQMLFGFPVLLGIGVIAEGNPLHLQWTPLALASLSYLTIIGSCMAFILYFWMLQRITVTKALLLLLVTPLVAVTLGKLVNNEELTWRLLAGGVCIIAGVGATIFYRQRTPASSSVNKILTGPLQLQEALVKHKP
ncbi:MAG: EamA family transporter [candidate division KSB1 bacterium]|nr:EamA family transporter [candidate division KSB1 bacterium]MDZ7369221.1 EamA family transporter [candidate division KSB1 bacterium]MDZ7407200.1 EamA family transporter [candidate division KSB1 bacterium]